MIGGGNTAIDCTRNLIRLGARKVYLVYRRTRKEMPANVVEIEAAEHEGAEFHFLCAPVKVVADDQGRVTHLEYLRMELGEPDASGRRRPVPVEGSETLLATDMVISAIGQAPDVSFVTKSESPAAGLKTTRWSTIEADPGTLQTNIPYLFVAGDVATGPALVVDAIGGGRRAARSIHQFVMGLPVDAESNELRKKVLKETIFDRVVGVTARPRCRDGGVARGRAHPLFCGGRPGADRGSRPLRERSLSQLLPDLLQSGCRPTGKGGRGAGVNPGNPKKSLKGRWRCGSRILSFLKIS